MYYTYVLLSEKDGKKYIGHTRDLKQRFEQHNAGYVQSTAHRRPLILVYYEACIVEEDAKRREKYFKTHYGRMFLAKKLKSYFRENGLTSGFLLSYPMKSATL